MDMKKTGNLLKELRKQKSWTQEQLAEQLNVSGRTVSRWETGNNMPDLDVLIELADLYEIDIRELIDGERKSENMDSETKDTLKKVADYTEQKTQRMKKKMIDNSWAALILLLFCAVLEMSYGLNGFIPERAINNITQFTMGLCMAILFLNILYFTGKIEALQNWKERTFKKK